MNWPRLIGLSLALCLHGAVLYAFIARPGSGAGADGSGSDNFRVVAEVSLESADLFTQSKQDAAADANPVQAAPQPVPDKQEPKTEPPQMAETGVPLETPRQEPPPEQQQTKPQMASVAAQAQDEQQAATALAARRNELWSKYSAQVSSALEHFKVKTRTAKESDVLLQFTVAPSGRLLDRAVIRSSGTPVLDRAAIASLERAAPFPPFPPELSSSPLTFTVPFQFRIR
jgi:protein TonB